MLAIAVGMAVDSRISKRVRPGRDPFEPIKSNLGAAASFVNAGAGGLWNSIYLAAIQAANGCGEHRARDLLRQFRYHT